MKRLLSTLSLALLSIACIFAVSPDFAYPRTTLDRSLAQYRRAVAEPVSHNIDLIESLLGIAGATASIDPDSLASVLPVVDKALAASVSPADSAMILTMRSELLMRVYKSHLWRFNSTDTPDTPLPADPMEWNGRQFSNSIAAHLAEAFRFASSANVPLNTYKAVIEADSLTYTFFPTVASFVASKITSYAPTLPDGSLRSEAVSRMVSLSPARSEPWFYWSVEHLSDLADSKSAADSLVSLYNANPGYIGSGYVLDKIAADHWRGNAPLWLVDSLRSFLKLYPGCWCAASLKNALGRLTEPIAALTLPSTLFPGLTDTVKVNYSYASTAGYRLYSVSRTDFNDRRFKKSKATPLATVDIRTDPARVNADTTMTIKLKRQGFYAIVPTVNGKADYSDVSFLLCSPFVASRFTSSFSDRLLNPFIAVSDFRSGAPVKGAVVTRRTASRRRTLGATDSDGLLQYPPLKPDAKEFRSQRSTIDVTYGGLSVNCFHEWPERSDAHPFTPTGILIITDRRLYHPGDTVRWAAIAHSGHWIDDSRLLPSVSIKVELLNPNRRVVADTVLVSDLHGRIDAAFATPADGLTGSFSLRASVLPWSDKKSPSGIHGSRSITVSDFKIPTFKLSDISVGRDVPSPGDVTLSGDAVTFTSMPVSSAKISVTVSRTVFGRMMPSPSTLGPLVTIDTVTASDGHFSIVIPDSILTADSRGSSRYMAEITVTTSDGQSIETSHPFVTGKPYSLWCDPGSPFIDLDVRLANPFHAVDADGKEIPVEIEWWISPSESDGRTSTAVESGTCVTGDKLSLDLAKLDARQWVISMAPRDRALADTVINAAGFTAYSISRNLVPPGQPLFFPTRTCKAAPDGSAVYNIGVSLPDTYLYTALCIGDSIVSTGLRSVGTGFHPVNVRLPDGIGTAAMLLYTVRRGAVYQSSVSISRESRRKLTLEGSSIRDRITSGDTEHWTLSLRGFENAPTSGAMIATMYNAALSRLQPYTMPSGFNIMPRVPRIGLDSGINGLYPSQMRAVIPYRPLAAQTLQLPAFNPSISMVEDLSSRKLLFNSATKIRGSGVAVETEESVADTFDTADVVAESKSADYTEGRITTTDAADEEAVAQEQTSGESSHNFTGDFAYRDGEALQALWMPDIVVGDSGDASIEFTVPNSNGTWAFDAFAWTSDLRSASLRRELVASKPVMVSANVPRLLRSGDRAWIIATAYNNSDSAAIVTTVVETFDLSTGNVTSAVTSSDLLQPSASVEIKSMVVAPDDVSALGYRVRSTLGGFTDGERHCIPVLPALSETIESHDIYLNPGDSIATVKIETARNGITVLDFTANPAWNIIRELTGIAAGAPPATAPQAVRSLFGAAVASGMVNSHPAISDAIRAWTAQPSAKDLLSRLSQNEELKAAALASTPWVQAASSDSERMARLALLFDAGVTSKSIASSIATLSKLQRPDGGWSWSSWSDRSSQWATSTVLTGLARLEAISYMPSDRKLRAMIDKGIAGYTASLDTTVTTDFTLAYISSLIPRATLGTRARRIVDATVNDIAASWPAYGTPAKASAAIILDANGRNKEALDVIAYLSEFAVTLPGRGTSFPSLDDVNAYSDLLLAFARVAPVSPLIDGIRQWLVQRQQTTVGLGSREPTRLIAAFVAAGSPWLASDAASVTVTLGGISMPVDSAEAATGHFVAPLPAGRNQTLTIGRDDTSVPAYGAVISRSTRKSAGIKAASCRDLSIQRRIAVMRDGRWQYTDDLRLGEQARIILTLNVRRDLEYVTITDCRPAALQPVKQLPGWTYSAGTGFYLEPRDAVTNLFVDRLPRGTYQIAIDMTASVAGEFSSGIATAQSQLTPAVTAHSASSQLKVK